ncbi:MAG: hypothetical protein JW900_13920 [Anaerolineae bacterium]|nr:hypothetical protein [Anaerolineae bacterium]
MNAQRLPALMMSVLLLLSLASACGANSNGGIAVVVTDPVDGATVTVGEMVRITSTATAEAGISRVELSVDGQVVRSDVPPGGANPATFAIAQPWTPAEVGTVVVSVLAYDASGAVSAPATITLRVVVAGAEATPVPTAPLPPGVTATPTPEEPPEECTLDAAFVQDVTIPDNMELEAGESFVKTWRLRNDGTCDWGDGFNLAFIGGDQMGGASPVPVPATAVGGTLDVSVNMTAPNDPGTYRGNWRLQSAEGVRFGSVIYVQIVVPGQPVEEGPAAPTNLQVTVQSDGYVKFTWTDNADDENGFYILADGLPHATVGPNVTEYGFPSGAYFCDKTVSVTVLAHRGGQVSNPSNAVDYTGPPCETSLPDLEPYGLTIEPSAPTVGADFRIDVSVYNGGDRPVGDFVAHILLLGAGQACPPDRYTPPSIERHSAVGARGVVRFSAQMHVDEAGDYVICLLLDPGDLIEEGQENNNAMGLNISVAEPD